MVDVYPLPPLLWGLHCKSNRCFMWIRRASWPLRKSPVAVNRPFMRSLRVWSGGWDPQISKTVAIGHGDCPDGARQLEESVRRQFPDAEIVKADIGPIIGAHTGPGMLALIYWGVNR